MAGNRSKMAEIGQKWLKIDINLVKIAENDQKLAQKLKNRSFFI